jgi:hypothetical protein
MDDAFQELENELKALRPRRPSALLRARLEAELGAPASVARRYITASTLRSWKWLSWPMAAAAALALVVSLGVWRWQAGPQALDPDSSRATAGVEQPEVATSFSDSERHLARASEDVYRPVKAANILYDLQDEGLVLLDDSSAARRVRARYVDTYTWRNPATNSSLKWSIPREEVRMMPTSFH